MTYTVASRQGTIEMFWLLFWGAVMLFNLYTVYVHAVWHPGANVSLSLLHINSDYCIYPCRQ